MKLELPTAAQQSRTPPAGSDAPAVAEMSDLRHAATPALVADAAARAAGARGVVVARVNESAERIEIVGAAGVPPEATSSRTFQPLGAPSPLASAARLRRPVHARGGVIADDELGTGRAVALPLFSGPRLLGVLGFEFSTAHALPGESARLGVIAVAAAAALERLVSEAGHRHAQVLQEATALLASVQPRAKIADAILAEAMQASDATAGTVALLEEGRRQLRIVAYRGWERSVIAAFQPVPLDLRTAVGDAAFGGEIVVAETAEELDRRYPEARQRRGRPADRASVVLPLVAGDAPIGAIALAFPTPHIVDEDEQAFLLALARLCAQALDRSERARLYDRLTQLQKITASLARAQTPADVGAAVISQALEAVGADSGRVAQLDPATGELVTIARSDVLDAVEARLRTAGEADQMPAAVAVAQNRTILIESLEDASQEWPVAARELGPLGAEAVAAVPLRSGVRAIGVIGLTWREAHHELRQHAPFLEALASVAAQALERTQLFEEVERSRRYLRRLLDRLGEAVLVVDEELRVTYANHGASDLFERHDLVGTLLPDRWPELHLREVAKLELTEDAQPVDETILLDDGRTLEVVALPDTAGATLVLRDVTRRERQERAEREFVANAAHELRTPLAGIASAVDALQLGAKETAERDVYIDGIAAEVRRLVRLSEALLLLARAQAEAEAFALEEVAVEPLLLHVAANLQVRPGVRVATELEDCTVRGHSTLLEAAVANLAQNASRHTESGSITLSCRRLGDKVLIEVSDTGTGISDKHRAHATQRFYRGDDRNRDGFGLGLSLASNMVAAIGGSLDISSGARSGTTVTITLQAQCEDES